MMRTLAWWGTNQSTSDAVDAGALQGEPAESTTARTARRNTSWPCIFK